MKGVVKGMHLRIIYYKVKKYIKICITMAILAYCHFNRSVMTLNVIKEGKKIQQQEFQGLS